MKDDTTPGDTTPGDTTPEDAPRRNAEPLESRIARQAAVMARHACDLADGYEFESYWCGARVPRDLAGACRHEQDAYRRTMRDALAEALAGPWDGRAYGATLPDVQVEAIPDQWIVALRVRPIYVAGRYRKLSRELSQTVFHCRSCRGRKKATCTACEGTGRMVAESVEDFVRGPVVRALPCRRAVFHGSGREDVDVRMLGTGRPFVVSVQRPKRRSLDLEAVARDVVKSSGGRVEVLGLRVVDRVEMKRLTTARPEKTYRVVARPSGDAERFPPDAADRVRSLVGACLQQRTPVRVSERRSDQIRPRNVLALEVEAAEEDEIVLVLTVEAGTYVKEFVSGDGGRTVPSLAEAVGVPSVCAVLDVLEVGEVGEV